MPLKVTKPAPPSSDKRWRLVDATVRRHGSEGHALIETLHTVQESFGFLRQPLSKVYGVATFYQFFTLKPKGEHTCVVCMGTACYIKGAPSLIDGMKQQFGISPGETTPDNKLSVLTARCVGSCGLAPAVVFDGEVTGKLDRRMVLDRLVRLTSQRAPAVAGGDQTVTATA
jgi:bidirectional [NiFe] hydrogenase diaphorase subunit